MARTTIRTEDITASEVTTAKMAVDPTNASNLASGTVGSARMGSGSASSTTVLYGDGTWKAEPTTDVAAIQNDIATLALQSAVQDHATAYNLPNAFIDQFEDDTGIDAETTVDRNNDEYMASAIQGDIEQQTLSDSYHGMVVASGLNGGPSSSCYDGTLDNNWCLYMTSPNNWDTFYYYYDFGSGSSFELSKLKWRQFETQAGFKAWKVRTSTGSEASGTFSDATGTPGDYSSGISGGYTASETNHKWNSVEYSSPVPMRVLRLGFNSSYTSGNAHAGLSEIEIYGRTATTNATGNWTSATQTANATVSKMGIVVLYKNNAGTATLDTDLIAQLSSNGGSNYTAAPLTAAGTFATGINIAVANDVTISNTGTGPKYKISFANQAEGSKETQVHGVALIY